ncbi:MAG TPA: DUF2339 domain-containing protein [Polyangiales bacterium]
MRWLLAMIGAVLGSVAFDEEGLFVGAAVGFVVGYIIEREQRRTSELKARGARPVTQSLSLEARVEALTARVSELERAVAQLRGQPDASPERAAADHEPPAAQAVVTYTQQPDERGYVAPMAQPEPIAATSPSQVAEQEDAELEAERARGVQPPVIEPRVREPAPPTWIDAVRDFVWGGNTVARAGVLVLTVGVGLLVKYAADHALLPLELRLGIAALIGLALVVLGYRLRTARPGFGTALQGGGVAAMYLCTFFAYYAYQLLPVALTLGLLIAIAVFSTVLAVVQNAVELAVFGAIGGFLAPVLASRGEGSHVALFSYYALLNAAIAASALYRAWRILNWVGFAFTFGIGSAWGALRYEPVHMASAAGFLALFFAFYVLVGTLFSLRRSGTVDTTLTFGTPLATLALAGGLFRLEHMYLALWCAGMSAIYLAVAGTLIARKDTSLRALAQSYIAVGVGVATLAIPFALDDALGTALAWAAEASALIWIGERQQRLRTRVAGYVLFSASVISLALHSELGDERIHALFLALIAAFALFASSCLERSTSLRRLEPPLGRAILALGFVLWIAARNVLIAPAHTSPEHHVALLLSAQAIEVLAFDWLGARLALTGLRLYPRFGFVLLLLRVLEVFSGADVYDGLTVLAGLFAVLASYWPLHQQEGERAVDKMHVLGAWTFALALGCVGRYLDGSYALAEGWSAALAIAPPLLCVALIARARPSWPFAAHARMYRVWAVWPILLGSGFFALRAQLASDGSAAPLPYLPLLNPLDLAQLAWVFALLSLARAPELIKVRPPLYAVAGLTLFIALNGTIVRTATHWAGVAFEPYAFPRDPLVQAAFSILWTVVALIMMVFAHRRATRAPWVVGAGLLALVVAKLFLLDLAKLGSGAKIVTFLAVGVLLLLIGYFAPVPPNKAKAEP